MSERGLDAGFGGILRRFVPREFEGGEGDESADWGEGLNAFTLGMVGGFVAVKSAFEGRGVDVSGSDPYFASRSAPVLMPPPVFLNFGMPTPAKIPPNWGAVGIPPVSAPEPVSLLLLILFAAPGI